VLCGEEGDVIALVALAHQLARDEAAAWLLAQEDPSSQSGASIDPLEVDENAPLDLKLAFFPQTDLGNAERFAARNKTRLQFSPAIGWLWWDGRRWLRLQAENAREAPGQVKRAEHECARAQVDDLDAQFFDRLGLYLTPLHRRTRRARVERQGGDARVPRGALAATAVAGVLEDESAVDAILCRAGHRA
jgi:hypothetical protein